METSKIRRRWFGDSGFTNSLNVLGSIVLLALLATPGFVLGQAQVNDQGRANPAPWRPSFGPVNKDATSAGQSENNAANSAPSLGGGTNFGSEANLGNGTNVGGASRTNSLPLRTASNNGVTAPGVTRVTRTFDTLPNEAGQVWREYDITPYTSRLPSEEQPQQAILDWILKETGTKLWFNQPMGLLNADRKRIVVYHTPEIQRVVKSMIDRFTRTRAQVQLFDINLVTIGKPNWRTNAYTMLQPIEVRSAGIEAWLMSKENAAILMSQLANRSDYKRHSGGRVASPDGQTIAIEKMAPVPFVRSIKWTPQDVLGYQPINTTINEGYSLAISSLTSLDNHSIEAMIKCDVDQVEKLTPVKVNVPQPAGRVSQLDLSIPQLVSWRLHERIRWPSDQVLLLSCGIVATPQANKTDRRGGLAGLLGAREAKRADALLFIEYRGPQSEPTVARTAGSGSLSPVQRDR